MSHTYSSLIVHYIFSTKNRERSISEGAQPRLWSYMGGIARKNRMKALAIGGIEDHCHLLISLPTNLDVAHAIQLIKAGSSKWMHEELGEESFAWQENYGAFTIGVSQVPATVKYINRQMEHHKRRGFDAELRMILRKHGIEREEFSRS